ARLVSDWSSDVCSSDLLAITLAVLAGLACACTGALLPAAPAPVLAEPAAPQAVAREEAKQPTAYLTGRVVDPEGKPVSAARVWEVGRAAWRGRGVGGEG